MRWMYITAKPEQNLPFSYKHADEARRQFLIPLWNVYSFFVNYANVDGWQPEDGVWAGASNDLKSVDNILDRWILARLQATIQEVTDRLENFETD